MLWKINKERKNQTKPLQKTPPGVTHKRIEQSRRWSFLQSERRRCFGTLFDQPIYTGVTLSESMLELDRPIPPKKSLNLQKQISISMVNFHTLQDQVYSRDRIRVTNKTVNTSVLS